MPKPGRSLLLPHPTNNLIKNNLADLPVNTESNQQTSIGKLELLIGTSSNKINIKPIKLLIPKTKRQQLRQQKLPKLNFLLLATPHKLPSQPLANLNSPLTPKNEHLAEKPMIKTYGIIGEIINEGEEDIQFLWVVVQDEVY